MNASEKSVLAVLGLSVFAGLFHLATSPLYDKNKNPTISADSSGDVKKDLDPTESNGNSTNKKPVYPFSV
jgi:hypothetical protein